MRNVTVSSTVSDLLKATMIFYSLHRYRDFKGKRQGFIAVSCMHAMTVFFPSLFFFLLWDSFVENK